MLEQIVMQTLLSAVLAVALPAKPKPSQAVPAGASVAAAVDERGALQPVGAKPADGLRVEGALVQVAREVKL